MIDFIIATVIDLPINFDTTDIVIHDTPYISAVEFDDSEEGDIAWAMVTFKSRRAGRPVPSRPFFRLKDEALPDTDIVTKMLHKGLKVWGQ